MQRSRRGLPLESPTKFLDVGHDDCSVERRIPRCTLTFAVHTVHVCCQTPRLIPGHPWSKIDTRAAFEYRETLRPRFLRMTLYGFKIPSRLAQPIEIADGPMPGHNKLRSKVLDAAKSGDPIVGGTFPANWSAFVEQHVPHQHNSLIGHVNNEVAFCMGRSHVKEIDTNAIEIEGVIR